MPRTKDIKMKSQHPYTQEFKKFGEDWFFWMDAATYGKNVGKQSQMV